MGYLLSPSTVEERERTVAPQAFEVSAENASEGDYVFPGELRDAVG